MEYRIVGTARCILGNEYFPYDMYVVFEGEDKELYIGFSTEQDGFVDASSLKRPNYVDRLYYTSFEKVNEEFKTNYCFRKLSETDNKMEEIEESYKVGDTVVSAFEYEENKAYIGRIDKFIEFIKTMETEDKDLKKHFDGYYEWYSSEMKKGPILRKVSKH